MKRILLILLLIVSCTVQKDSVESRVETSYFITDTEHPLNVLDSIGKANELVILDTVKWLKTQYLIEDRLIYTIYYWQLDEMDQSYIFSIGNSTSSLVWEVRFRLEDYE